MVHEATSTFTPDAAAASSNPWKPGAEEWGAAQLAKITAFFIPRLADPVRQVRGSARKALACLRGLVFLATGMPMLVHLFTCIVGLFMCTLGFFCR
jgi:hypothetical protein